MLESSLNEPDLPKKSDAPGWLGALGIDEVELVLRRMVLPSRDVIPLRLLLVCKYFHRTLTALATSLTLRHPPPTPIVSTRLLKITVDLSCVELLRDGDVAAFGRLCSQLRHLDLSGTMGLTPAALQPLSSLTALTFLSLDHCNWVTDVAMAHLAHLPSLQHLSLDSVRLDVTGVAILARIASLTHLNISRSAVPPLAIQHLTPLTALRTLDLSSVHDLSDVHFSHLATLTTVEEVKFMITPHTSDAAFKLLARLPILRALDIDLYSYSASESLELPSMSALTTLRHLHLPHLEVSVLPFVSQLHSLTSLGFHWPDGTTYNVLSRLTALQALTLSLAGSRAFPQLLAVPTLTSLTLVGGIVCPFDALDGLRQMPLLRSLHFDRCRNFAQVSLAGVTALAALTGLRLASVDVTDVTMSQIAALTGLRLLSVVYCLGLTDAGVAQLSALTALRRLQLQDAFLTSAALGALPGLAALTELDLAECHKLSYDAFEHLAQLPALQRVLLPIQLAGDSVAAACQRWPALDGVMEYGRGSWLSCFSA